MKNKIIVSFFVGRGGRFYNAGHKSYIGEKTIGDILSMTAEKYWTFIHERDKKGRFITPQYFNHNGDPFDLTVKQVKSGVGVFDIDGQYCMYFSQFVEDCTEEELKLIINSGEYKSFDLCEYFEKTTNYKFGKYGELVCEDED